MIATLPSIRLAYLVVTGDVIPGDKPFVKAGEEVIKEIGIKRAQKLFAQCATVISNHPVINDYRDLVQEVTVLQQEARA